MTTESNKGVYLASGWSDTDRLVTLTSSFLDLLGSELRSMNSYEDAADLAVNMAKRMLNKIKEEDGDSKP